MSKANVKKAVVNGEAKEKKTILILIFFASLVIVTLYMFLTHKVQYGDQVEIVNTNDYYWNVTQREIVPDKEYTQSFSYEGERLYSFCLKYLLIESKPEASWRVQLRLKDDTRVIQEWLDIPSDIVSGSLKEYVINDESGIGTGEYEICVFTNNADSTGVALLGSDNDSLLRQALTVNDEAQEGDLTVQYSQIRNVKVTLVYAFITILLVSGFLTCFARVFLCKKYVLLLKFVRNILEKTGKSIVVFLICGVISVIAVIFFSGIREEITEVQSIFWITVCLLVLAFVFQKNNLQKKPEILVCMSFILIGLLYIISVPAEAEISWDESIHFWRAVGLSHANTGIANLAESWMYWRSGIPFGLPGTKEGMESAYQMIQDIYNMGQAAAANTDVLSNLYLVAYIPAAIALKVGRGLNLPYWIVFKMGAFANFLFDIMLLYFGMRRIKSGKMIMTVIAGMGTAFFLTTVYSSDGWIIAMSMLGFAYFIGIMQENTKIKNRELVVMLASLTLAFFPKVIYFPMLLLLVLLPKNRFESERQYYRFIAGVFASVAFLGCEVIFDSVWFLPFWIVFYFVLRGVQKIFVNMSSLNKKVMIGCAVIAVVFLGLAVVKYVIPIVVGSGDMRGGEEVNASLQVKGIVENPWGYIKMLFYFLKEYLSFQNSMKINFATLGYLGTTNYSILGLVLMVFVCATDKNNYDIWNRYGLSRCAALILSGICVILIASALYISFTPVGYGTVLGCQQRYILPLLFPILALIAPKYIDNKINRKYYNGAVLAVVCMILLANIWTVAVKMYL